VESVTPREIPFKITRTLAEYYIANKPCDGGWAIIPQTNLDAYFGSTAFTKMYLPKLPPEFIERKESSFGVEMYRAKLF